jgi:hypothetical protein
VSVPRFIDRVLDSTVSVLGEVDRSAIVDHISSASIALRCPVEDLTPVNRAGFVLAANLAARLYPKIYLEADEELTQAAAEEISSINPRCNIEKAAGSATATLNYEAPARGEGEIAVFARGWNVYLDSEPKEFETANPPAALLAAAWGIGEAFRVVFAAQLGDRGRRAAKPFAFNMITLGDPKSGLPWADGPEIGRFNLVGAGAVGQAAAHTLAVSGARGTMVAVDHETLTLSNLQRYVLGRDSDVGAVKVKLLKQRLDSPELKVMAQRSKWEVGRASKRVPSLVALDSAAARIELQASLPGPIYNAWTQPADVGFSRHEHFGEQPCLACLYWPTQSGPSRHEQIGSALNQHPIRCLAYLVQRDLPVGMPLPPAALQALPDLPIPAEAIAWTQTPIIDDIASAAGVDPGELTTWRGRSLADLYQEGICGGAVLDLGVGEAPREALVPLAHQSAFAGIMLATQLLAASDPFLSGARPAQIEGRYDLLSGGPQVLAMPRARTPGCLCSDDVFLAVYAEKFLASDGGESVEQ